MSQIQYVETWLDDHKVLNSAARFIDGELIQTAKPDLTTDSLDEMPLKDTMSPTV